MMKVKLFITQSGRSPIEKYIDGLPREERTKCYGVFSIVVEYGRNTDPKFLKKLQGQRYLWEIRVTTHREHRFLCTIDQNMILILHAFIKKTQKTPLKDLAVAQRRLQEYRQ